MKLSVIIVSYNEKQYIEQTIDSCLNQNFDDTYEIIIGDDGSDDGSIDIIKEYTVKYPDKIRYFVMDRENVTDVIPSVRASNVILRAFSMVKGQYITLLSADDLIVDSDKFKKQIEFLDNNKDYFSCYTDFKYFWNNGKEKQIIFNYPNYSNFMLWGTVYIHISCFIFRSEILNFPIPKLCDDTGLFFAILKYGKTYGIQGVMFGYRQRENSITHNAKRFETNLWDLFCWKEIEDVGGYYFSTLSRFSKPLYSVYKNRKNLNSEKYRRLIDKNFKKSSLIKICNYDKLNILQKILLRLFLIKTKACRNVFHFLKLLIELKNKKNIFNVKNRE